MSSLNRRAQKILHAVVTEYLHGEEAVGSRTVTRRHDLGLSPATVRNVMADLEEMGLLEQRHSSAGRVPTATGLRFFIDSLLKVRGLSGAEKEEIRQRVSAPTRDEVVHRASRLLSDLTQHAAVIIAPDPDAQRLTQVEFVPLRDGKLIAVLVTADGQIENRLIADDIDPRRLEGIHNYLNQMLSGMTLDEIRERVIRELADDKNRYDEAISAALRLGHALFVERKDRPADVVISGQANLIDETYAQDRTRDLLRTLEDKENLVRLLDRTRRADGIQVFLGAETALHAFHQNSVIAMSYGPEDQPIGALAVIAQECRAAGLRVIGGTLLPAEGWHAWDPDVELIRRQVNAWIRSGGGGLFTGIADFDAAVRDPAQPDRLLAGYDSGDHLHPNDAGDAAMAAAVPLDAL